MREQDVEYVRWQNRATRFYLASRSLYDRQLFGPSAYCCHQAVELIMKATLIYWDASFRPFAAGHNLAKMVRMTRNKVRGGRNFVIPSYLTHEQRFLRVTRYPTQGKGVLVPGHMIDDLDQVFADLILLVPFQFNTELLRSVTGRNRRDLLVLRRRNKQMRRLRRFLAAA